MKEKPVPTVLKEIAGLSIRVPVGSLDKPSPESEAVMRQIQHPENWKLDTLQKFCATEDERDDLAYCLDWYMGGHEVEVSQSGKGWYVSSRGYYHYVGS